MEKLAVHTCVVIVDRSVAYSGEIGTPRTTDAKNYSPSIETRAGPIVLDCKTIEVHRSSETTVSYYQTSIPRWKTEMSLTVESFRRTALT